MSKRTLVIGASTKPGRYANLAIEMLKEYGHEVMAFGKESGLVGDTLILQKIPEDQAYDTVTMYVSPANQLELMPTILGLHPKRIIFNPGTENPAFEKEALLHGIEVENACTLVMLRSRMY
jgi:predicted CoA-binding protein